MLLTAWSVLQHNAPERCKKRGGGYYLIVATYLPLKSRKEACLVSISYNQKVGNYTSDDLKKVYYQYDTRVRIMGDKVEVREYSERMRKLKKGIDSPFVSGRDYTKKESGEIRKDSLYRSSQLLDGLVACNQKDFISFLTLTFAKNEKDLTIANRKFNKWTESVRKKLPDFKYLAVPEFQKRGAVHYHILSNIPCGSDLIPARRSKSLYNPSSKKTTLLEYYSLKYWTYGYSSAFDIKTTDSNFNISKYIQKYFWKDIDNRFFGRRKILYSQNLEKPMDYFVNSDSQEMENILTNLIENDYKLKRIKTIINKNDYGPRMFRISKWFRNNEG